MMKLFKKKRTNGNPQRKIQQFKPSWFFTLCSCRCRPKNEDDEAPYGEEMTVVKSDGPKPQDSQAIEDTSKAIEDTSSKHLDLKEIEQTTSKRVSLYDNIPAPQKTEAALIHKEPSLESEGTTNEDLANQEQYKKSYNKPKDSAIQTETSHQGKESENGTSQKQSLRFNVESQVLPIHKETSREKEGKKSEHATSHVQSKPKETAMDNDQEIIHLPALMTSVSQPLCEVNTVYASGARSLRIENTDNIKSQKSVQSQRTTMSEKLPDISLSVYFPKSKETPYDTHLIHHKPVGHNLTTKNQRLEKNSCPGLCDVNETYDKTRNLESPYYAPKDTIDKRSTRSNLYYDKPSVDQSISENSGYKSYNAGSIVYPEKIQVKSRDTICDSRAEIRESSGKSEDEKTIVKKETEKIVHEIDATCRAEEKLLKVVTSNPDTVTIDLNAENGLSDNREENGKSGKEQYSHGHLKNARNEDKLEELAEELRKTERPGGQTLETNLDAERGEPADKSTSINDRPTEDVPITTDLDSSKDKKDTSPDFERDQDKRNNASDGRKQSKGEGQGTANVKQNTMKARRPVGLQNQGNTCFFNSVLQNLNQSFLLYDLLVEKGLHRLSLTKSMVKLYEKMCSGVGCTVPSEVLNNICQRSPRFAGGRQQDSHELLRHLLDGLRNEERENSGNPNDRKTLTEVDKVFGGHFITVYTCKDCKKPYHVCEPMLDISLPIAYEDLDNNEESDIEREENETDGEVLSYQKAAESLMTPLAVEDKKAAQDSRRDHGSETERQQPSTNKKKNKKKNRNKKRVNESNFQHSLLKKSRAEGRSILDCLGAFTRTEHIIDEYLCMACHAERVNQGATDYKMTSAKKRTLIYNPPALLTLHLKRFQVTAYGLRKCNDEISFQDMIDIGPYCSSWCMRNKESETSIWYSLYGIVVHSGSLDGGHYVAYIKMRKPGDNARQFIQKSFLDRQQLTEEKLVEMMREMQRLPKTNHENKCKPQPANGTWFYVSDSHCSGVSEDEVWRQQAYLLFYERRQSKTQSGKCAVYVRTAETGV